MSDPDQTDELNRFEVFRRWHDHEAGLRSNLLLLGPVLDPGISRQHTRSTDNDRPAIGGRHG